eukprot:c20582_g1_i1.p1 GENE.c20582_g1_i1~~c20582_g1_i1.p1  ORF type:complete len:371 (-),score=71.29 c20582_g1_i1:404-1516(-)
MLMTHSRSLALNTSRPILCSLLTRSYTKITVKSINEAREHLQNKTELLAQMPKKFQSNNSLTILGSPLNFGQPITGVEQGPRLLRESDMKQRLLDLGWKVSDMGDTELVVPNASHPTLDPILGRAKSCFAIGQSMHNIYQMALPAMNRDEFVLLMGGDHSVAIGSVTAALKRHPNMGVIWVDAHADLNTPTSSPSGNMHGMPLSFLIPSLSSAQILPGFEWMSGCNFLDPAQLVYIGLRDVDPGEIEMIRSMGILAFTMHDIDRLGIGLTMEIALDHLTHSNGGVERPLHLSYDIDAFDPLVAPATGTKVPGGLSYREGNFVAEYLSLTGQLRSMDIVEVNCKLSDKQGVQDTVDTAVDVVLSALGKNIV